MQRIDNIEIKNFKSIRHQKIEGCKRVNVFIGYPNVGKSNILEAISTIEYCKAPVNQDFHNFCRFEKAAEVFFEANVKEPVHVSYNKLTKVNIEYLNENELEFYANSFDSQTSIHGFAFEPKLIDIDVFKYHFYLDRTENNVWTLKHLQSPFGENLFAIIGSNVELRKSFNSLLNQCGIKLLVDKVSNSIRLIKEINEDSIFQLSYSLLADTLQRLFFYRTAIFTNNEAVLLFEEPESHMFPPYISKFTSDIIYDENGNQFFITTHSPFVLNDFMDNLKSDELSIYIVGYKKETGETIIYKMSDGDMHEAYQFGYDFFMNLDKFIPFEQHDQV
ncbi:MAG: AAA family ATPase [Ginsengibacter sp.]